MKYLSECCKVEAIIRNNDIALCPKCGEECDVLERWNLSQTLTQKCLSEILQVTFSADDMIGNYFGQELRKNTPVNQLLTFY